MTKHLFKLTAETAKGERRYYHWAYTEEIAREAFAKNFPDKLTAVVRIL